MDFDLTTYMRANGIRSIVMMPDHIGGFQALLTCGGPAGCGNTVGDAIADAKTKNAGWLGFPARHAA